jgi:alpha-amylase/alpha-mannosidase (GH57 family)
MLRAKLVDAGFEVSMADTSLFICRRRSGSTFVLIYVDDGLIVGHKEDVAVAIQVLEQHFKLRKMGAVEYFLGSEVIRDRGNKTIIVTQRKYAKTIVAAAGQVNAIPRILGSFEELRSVPLEVNIKLSKEGEEYLEDANMLRLRAC